VLIDGTRTFGGNATRGLWTNGYFPQLGRASAGGGRRLSDAIEVSRSAVLRNESHLRVAQLKTERALRHRETDLSELTNRLTELREHATIALDPHRNSSERNAARVALNAGYESVNRESLQVNHRNALWMKPPETATLASAPLIPRP
jgi:hypothetical protein